MQDYALTKENASISLAVIADGVSTCKNSRIGAEIACQAVNKILSEESDYFFSCKEKYAGVLVLNYVRRVLRERAQQDGEDLNSYASTLSFVCRQKKTGNVMLFSLGDSKVYTLGEGAPRPITRSVADECTACPATVTKGAEDYIQLQVFEDCPQTDYLLMTDGAWRQMYVNCFMRSDIRTMLQNRDFNAFAQALEQTAPTDDCSFIAMNSTEELSHD